MADALNRLRRAAPAVAALALLPAAHAQHEGHAAPAERAEHAPPSAAPQTADAVHALGDLHLEDPLNASLLLDRFEVQQTTGDPLAWDVDAWVGRDLTKLAIRSEGRRRDGDTEHSELELLLARAVAPWWELVAGARADLEPAGDRGWAAVGVRGLAPYRIALEATAYLGSGGRSALRVDTRYELLVTNRWILEPSLELDWYGQSDSRRLHGAGLATGEIGLRMRYELRREVAPYFGIERVRRFGRSADLARNAGHDPDDSRAVAGVRVRL